MKLNKTLMILFLLTYLLVVESTLSIGGQTSSKDEHGNYIRNEAYKTLKNEIPETIISRVEKEVAPGLRSHILFYEVATPVTHWRYTGNKNGTMMKRPMIAVAGNAISQPFASEF